MAKKHLLGWAIQSLPVHKLAFCLSDPFAEQYEWIDQEGAGDRVVFPEQSGEDSPTYGNIERIRLLYRWMISSGTSQPIISNSGS